MSKGDHEQWLPEAEKVTRDDNPLKVPYHEALQEAVTAADFVERDWEPTDRRPGMVRVQKRVPRTTTGTIRSLVRAVQEAQTQRLMQVDPVMVEVTSAYERRRRAQSRRKKRTTEGVNEGRGARASRSPRSLPEHLRARR